MITVAQVQAAAALAAAIGPVLEQVTVAIYGIVQGIEKSLPQSTGTQKFDAAMTEVKSIFGPIATEFENNFGGLVNGAVAVLNAIGTFKHSSDGTQVSSTTTAAAGLPAAS